MPNPNHLQNLSQVAREALINSMHKNKGASVDVSGDTLTGELVFTSGSDTSTAAASTINAQSGQITTEALTTAAAAEYTFTLTNSNIAATSVVLVSVGKGTATAGTPVVAWVTPGAGSVVIIIQNAHVSSALDGTITINFLVIN